MTHPRPRRPSRRHFEQLLSKTKEEHSTANRIDLLSRQFVGYRYKSNPLIGSVDSPEIFTISLDGFDCVTYIETVLALTLASTVDDFTEWVRKIRYDRGRIQWQRRNHYMAVWVHNNVRQKIIKPISLPTVPIVSRERFLNGISGLNAERITVKCVPKRTVPKIETHLQTGDLIFFVSTRKNLDVFHAGIIIRKGNIVIMRHASRSKGCVVEQELSEFLKMNRMAGVIVVRPRGVTRRHTASI
jgi:hypothetical protein